MQGIFNNNAAIRHHSDSNGYLTGEIRVELDRVVENDLEGFNDLLSETLIGSLCGQDIMYEVVGFERTNNVLLLDVTLDATLHLAEYGDEEDEDQDSEQ